MLKICSKNKPTATLKKKYFIFLNMLQKNILNFFCDFYLTVHKIFFYYVDKKICILNLKNTKFVSQICFNYLKKNITMTFHFQRLVGMI